MTTTRAMDMVFDYEKLSSQASGWAKEFRDAQPFPHIVLDSIIPKSILKDAENAFPGKEDQRWTFCLAANNPVKNKQAIWDIRRIPQNLNQIIYELNSGPFIEFLETLTGIKALLPDPHLFGAGIHQSLTGGRLDIHVDHNINTRINLYRRLSLVLFLNEDWKEEYGGALELWSASEKKCIRRVMPALGKMIVFQNSETSFHGHPTPLQCPETVTRKSIAVWYLSTEPDPSYNITVAHPASFLSEKGTPATSAGGY